jgi:hypothetical protein
MVTFGCSFQRRLRTLVISKSNIHSIYFIYRYNLLISKLDNIHEGVKKGKEARLFKKQDNGKRNIP